MGLRKWLGGFAGGLLTVMLVAQPNFAQSPEPPAKIRVALNGFERNLTPFTVTFSSLPNTHDLLHLVYDSLFWSQTSANPEAWLATSAKPSGDRKNWTVSLRRGVTWHDGKPFTAEDVKFSFEYYKKFSAQSGRYGHHIAELPAFDKAEIIDPQTVRLSFEGPAPSFKIMPGADLPILPKHIWEPVAEPVEATFLPVGTGPYKVAEIVGDESYRLVANDDYFKGKPLVNEIELPVISDPDAAFEGLKTGDLHAVAASVPPDKVDELTRQDGLTLVKGTRLESVQLNLNTRKAPLSDPVVRKAISLAIDNDVLVKSVLRGRGAPGLDGFTHPKSPWSASGRKHEFDVRRAGQMLDSAGYSNKDATGVRRTPAGAPLEFTVLFPSSEPHHLKTLETVFQMTSAIGVRLNPETIDPADLRTRRRPPSGQAPDFDIYISTLESHAHADPDALYYYFHSPGEKGIGAQITGYSNAEFDSLAEKAAGTTSVNERKQLLGKMQGLLARDAPVISLFYPEGAYAYRPAAYSGWIPDPGHGVFTKRSFLKDYAKPDTAVIPGEDVGISPALLFLGVVGGMVLIGSLVVVVAARRRRLSEEPVEPFFADSDHGHGDDIRPAASVGEVPVGSHPDQTVSAAAEPSDALAREGLLTEAPDELGPVEPSAETPAGGPALTEEAPVQPKPPPSLADALEEIVAESPPPTESSPAATQEQGSFDSPAAAVPADPDVLSPPVPTQYVEPSSAVPSEPEAPAQPGPVPSEATAQPGPVPSEAPAQPESVPSEAPAQPGPVPSEAPAQPEPVPAEAPPPPGPGEQPADSTPAPEPPSPPAGTTEAASSEGETQEDRPE